MIRMLNSATNYCARRGFFPIQRSRKRSGSSSNIARCIASKTTANPAVISSGMTETRWYHSSCSSSSWNTSMRPGNTDASFLYLRGDHPYGSREYLWVQHAMDADTSSKFTTTETKESTTLLNLDGLPLHIIASLKAHRNIVFGATVGSTTYASRSDCSSILTDTCRPLLRAALDDCSKDGEQPQAVSALHGLSVYVRSCLQGERQSAVLDKLGLRNSNDSDNPSPVSTPTTSTSDAATLIEVAAVTAIATGVPRPGHSVVGQGTYRDGAVAWEALARDFIALKLCDECELYRSANAELVQIELLADTSPDYLASAGGAMARFFFL